MKQKYIPALDLEGNQTTAAKTTTARPGLFCYLNHQQQPRWPLAARLGILVEARQRGVVS